MTFNNQLTFKRFAPSQEGVINLLPQRQSYFHATSNFLFNASTSMWIFDSGVVLLFGPPNLEEIPDFLTNGEWAAESRAYQMESNCTTMKTEAFRNDTRAYVLEWDSQNVFI
jgi:hypothetical protein